MLLIKKYHNESEYTEYNAESITEFMVDNLSDLSVGYRIYDQCAAVANDITENPEALLSCEEMIMLRPAKGDVISSVAGVLGITFALNQLVKLFAVDVDTATSTSYDSQTSATNSLGDRTNEAAIGSRRDDIWGKVAQHVPRLIQVPHFRFDSNVEQEHFALHISEGKVLMENVQDGTTDFSLITNGKFNAWYPGGNPNNAVTPDYTIGGTIDRELYNVSKSTALSESELLPPNDLSVGGTPVWLFSSDTTTGTITLSNYEALETNLQEVFSVGDDVTLFETSVLISTFNRTYYRDNSPAVDVEKDFAVATPLTDYQNISGTYEILTVSEDNITIDVTGNGWLTFTDASLLDTYYVLTSSQSTVITTDSEVTEYSWFTDDLLTDPVVINITIDLDPLVSGAFDASIGPIAVEDGCDTISLNFVSSSGFYKLVSNTETSITVNIEITLQELDSEGDFTGTTATFNTNYSSNSSSTTSQAALTYDITNPFEYSQIICRRTTNRDKGDNVSNSDSVNWRDLYFYTDIGTQDYGNVTMAQVIIPSSIVARRVTERAINLDVTRYITPYLGDGLFGPEAPVSTWAEVLIATALDPYNGRLTIDEIDADLLLDVQQQLIDYYGTSKVIEVGYDLDDTSLRYQDIYSLFCNAVNVKAYSQGAMYKAYPDINREVSSKQFTHRNKVQGTDTKERIYEVDYDGIELTYRSNETGQSETIELHVDGVSSFNRYSVNLSGAVNEETATIRANRELNILKYQKYSYSFEADGISQLTVPGERVDNVDNTRIVKRDNNTNTYNIYDGYVKAQNGLELELSQPVYFEDGETHTIRTTSRTGELLESIECTPGQNAYFVILSQAPSEAIYTGFKSEKTTFTFASDATRLQLPVLVRELKAKSSNGLKTRTVSAINYSSLYYTNDKDYSEV